MTNSTDTTDVKLRVLAIQDLSMCCNTLTDNQNVKAYIARLENQLRQCASDRDFAKLQLASTKGRLDDLTRRMGDKLSFVQELFDKNLLPGASMGIDLIDAVPEAIAVLKKLAAQGSGGVDGTA